MALLPGQIVANGAASRLRLKRTPSFAAWCGLNLWLMERLLG
jgi:hypothetical protein